MAERNGRLTGKVALVTGAADGIGRAIAQRFAREGAKVVCADVNDDGLAQTRSPMGEAGVACQCDVARSADAARAVAVAVEKFGALHILVNAAAVFIEDGTVATIPEEDWERTTRVNLTGVFLMCKHAVPAIAAAGGGSIIHVASQLGSVAVPGMAWYCAQKGALIQLARAMALDHAAQNIRVNSLSPGPVETPRMVRRHGGPEAAKAKLGDRTALERLGLPEEIANAALFVASDEAAFMTGADVLVDGGYNAR